MTWHIATQLDNNRQKTKMHTTTQLKLRERERERSQTMNPGIASLWREGGEREEKLK